MLKNILYSILALESRLILKKYRPFVVAVTGSVGKTATKDAIFCALSTSGFVRKSEKSFNSEIGLPLTIIGVPNAWRSVPGWIGNMRAGLKLILKRSPYPEVLVLEVGADHPGDIRRVVSWLRPDIAVMTKVGDKPVHVEFFASPADVFKEKSYLARAVKRGGSLVFFADEPKIVSLGEDLKGKNSQGKGPSVSLFTFGLSDAASVRGTGYAVSYEDRGGVRAPTGFSFKIEAMGDGGVQSFPVSVKRVIGATFMYPLLAAVAVARARGMDLKKAVDTISAYEAPRGRMNIVPGMKGSTLIDDTYNSSPDAASAALDALKAIECEGKRIAVLGDMMELGSYSAEEHRNIGKKASETADVLVTVGLRAQAIADQAVASGMPKEKILSFSSSVEAGRALADMLTDKDIILIKGSQSVRMERATKMLMADHSQAEKLLVRQEKEWLDKA